MMKNKYIFLVLFVISFLTSCEKESEGLSSVLKFEILGQGEVVLPIGTEYVDAGFKITLDGKDVSSDVKVTGEVDYETVGLYNITYSYRNENTGLVTKDRTVIVCDPTIEADMSGEYVTTLNSKVGSTVFSNQPVTITKIAAGFFQISDFLGGAYATYMGYGKAYACSGYVQLKSDNTFVLLSSSILPWGDTLEGVSNGNYDPTSNIVKWEALYAGMQFNVELEKE